MTVPPSHTYFEDDNGGSIPASWDGPEGPEVLPLWECGASFIARIGSGSETRYIDLDFEDPEDPVVIGTSVQAVLAYLLFFVLEDLGGAVVVKTQPESHARFVRLAEELGFNDSSELIGFQERIHGEPEWHPKLVSYTASF